MGDSTCLMQPFCYASGINNEANENNTMHALGQSISFGRFMSESLAWDKWSSFSQNRYVEEAERFSRPGSVAQKKAFFEAHYKKLAAQKAAALLAQQANNNAAQNNVIGKQDIVESNNSSPKSPNYEVVVKEEPDAKVLSLSSESDETSHDLDSSIKTCVVSERNKLEESETEMEQEEVLRNSMKVELQKTIENVDTLQEQSEKLSATPPIMTPILKASKEMQKHSSLTPLTEKKRNKTPSDSSASRNHTAGPKWRLLSGENKMRSPIISSPFSLRTEERAARRKKKLEEKFNANETQKVQLHTKLKEKAGSEIRKLRQSFCFQARPLPDFYKERKASNMETRKVPPIHYESTNEGRHPPTLSMEEYKTSLPPNRPSLRNIGTKNFMGKNGHPLTSNSMKIITTHENTSPNIQHWKQNVRNYK
uniref:Protein WVD2-like 7 isoform X2 n=1 Tax=Cicer arietinum TaxID=3827 RepID=A0A3Q7XU55_CICAR|nr:protein WVD2-like 7 isoform X2 [Cicer arietinum]